jgi:hypothetical protein
LLRGIERIDHEPRLGWLEAHVLHARELQLRIGDVIPLRIEHARLEHRAPHAFARFKLRQYPFKLIAVARSATVAHQALEVKTSTIVFRVHRLIPGERIAVVLEESRAVALRYLPNALRKDGERNILNAAHLFSRQQRIQRCTHGWRSYMPSMLMSLKRTLTLCASHRP